MGSVATPGVRVMDRKVSVYEAILDAGMKVLQPVGQGVEVGEAGRYADHRAAVRADRLDLVQRSRHDL